MPRGALSVFRRFVPGNRGMPLVLSSSSFAPLCAWTWSSLFLASALWPFAFELRFELGHVLRASSPCFDECKCERADPRYCAFRDRALPGYVDVYLHRAVVVHDDVDGRREAVCFVECADPGPELRALRLEAARAVFARAWLSIVSQPPRFRRAAQSSRSSTPPVDRELIDVLVFGSGAVAGTRDGFGQVLDDVIHGSDNYIRILSGVPGVGESTGSVRSPRTGVYLRYRTGGRRLICLRTALPDETS